MICKDDLNAGQIKTLVLNYNGRCATYPKSHNNTHSYYSINPFNKNTCSSSYRNTLQDRKLARIASGTNHKETIEQPVDLIHNLGAGHFRSMSTVHSVEHVQSCDNLTGQGSPRLCSPVLRDTNSKGPAQISWSDAVLVQIPATLLCSMVRSNATPLIPRIQSMQNFGFNTGGSLLGWEDIYNVYETPRDDENGPVSWRNNIPRNWYLPLINISIHVCSVVQLIVLSI